MDRRLSSPARGAVFALMVAVLLSLPGVVSAQEAPLPDPAPSPSPSPSPEPPPPQAEAPPAPQYPPLPEGSGWGRRVVYSNSQQRVWLVEGDGNVVASHLVSGRKGVPRPGTYKVFSKSVHTTALRGRVKMNHMVRFARGRSLAIGFHSIPVYRRSGVPLQTVEQLGTFRSAGCVRMHPDAAAALFSWAHIGTQVVVTR